MRLLIDCDNILFRTLSATQFNGTDQEGNKIERPYYYQLRACTSVMERVLDDFDNPEYVAVLGGSGNFRKKLYPLYKANRKDAVYPRYLWDVRQHFIKYWGAILSAGCETDDVIASLDGEDTVKVVYDKDYLQLGGVFYNPWESKLYKVDNPWFYFWKQMLVGCQSDNVPGLLNPKKLHHKNPPKYTDPTATELLEGKTPNEQRMLVEQQYQLIYGDNWYERFDLIANLLWLRRDINKTYRDYLPD